ncbi:MAG TPA: hypothetical protein VFO10_07800 [Oligoflexus sp.]|uniref:hypothetical protein n=1 Tax=Oligoflexus sp. TaxID=1971216 RepID=UPI002D7ED0AA|nr:hypothetical protein [Oligoflexus sp.]HET9237138.1 hypothetical protein [Oligoflexus sp.]
MITSHSVKWILAGALIIPGLTGCSFFGGGDETAEVATSEESTEAAPEGDAPQAEEASIEGAETLGAENGMAESNALNDAAVAEAANAAAGPAGGGLPGSEIPPELLANGGAAMATDPTAANAAMGSAPGSAPAAPGFSAAPSDVRVYYVNAASATLHNSPDAASQSVGALKKGDPVLVKVEGNWANVVNRGWVELASLSMSPVSRGKAAKAWN